MLLYNLQLPGFGTSNWQSRIRKEVRLHEKYADLNDWTGRETTDLVYTDDGTLAEILVQKRYIRAGQVADDATYLFEVKSTTAECQSPFYMSDGQYNLMQSKSTDSSTEAPISEVYVLFRVFNIDLDRIGMRVYLDPEFARLQGDLNFSVDRWTGRTQ